MAGVVQFIPRVWTVERVGMSGDLAIRVDGVPLVTLHYDYRYTSNAGQWSLAEKIVGMLSAEGDTYQRLPA